MLHLHDLRFREGGDGRPSSLPLRSLTGVESVGPASIENADEGQSSISAGLIGS